ncbi:MAG: histidine kinase, partial [Pseudonocardia sp.]|nr:histidine kinase [Pseudonocardia sp.]
TGLVVLPLLTAVLAQLRGVVSLPSQMLLYLLAVVVVALVGGLLPALAAAVAAAALLDYYFIPPLYDIDVANPNEVVALVAFLLVAGATSAVVGLAARRREAEATATATAASREQLRRLADEQAALRRVATLVAHGRPPGEVLAAVAHEVGHVLGADGTNILRLDPDGATTVVARVGAYIAEFPIGTRWTPEPPLALAAVLRTGRPTRIDDFSQASDAYGDAIRRLGLRSGVAVPIIVQGHLWGAIAVGTRHERFPPDTEERMAGFTELVGTAIANAEGRAQLEESRDELRRLAQEQAALRRVATLVARGLPPAEIFPAVAHEVGHVLGADTTSIVRLDPDGATTVLARVGEHPDELAVGRRLNLEPPLPLAVALRTGRPARLDDFSQAADVYGDRLRRLGIRSAVAAPIIVDGRLWGAIAVGTRRERLPGDTEKRLGDFTELVGTAIANADSRAQLTASRARIVAAADDARSRIERDLHDGTQQRLVSLSLELRLAHSEVPADLPELQTQIGQFADELGEPGHAPFGVGRETLAPRPDGDRAPETPLDDDRRHDPRPESEPTNGVAVRVGGGAEVVDAGRVAGVQDRRQGQRWLGRPAASYRELGGVCADTGRDGRRAVGIEAEDVRSVGTEDVADLVRDGREHLGRWHPVGDQRGDPPQRGLLVGEPAQFLAALGVRGRKGFGLAAARGQADNRAHRTGDEEESDQGHHVVRIGDGEVVQRRDEVVIQQHRGRDRGGQRRNQPTDQRHHHDGEQVEQRLAGQVHDVAKLDQSQGQQGKNDQPGQRPGQPTPRGQPRPKRWQPSSGRSGLRG